MKSAIIQWCLVFAVVLAVSAVGAYVGCTFSCGMHRPPSAIVSPDLPPARPEPAHRLTFAGWLASMDETWRLNVAGQVLWLGVIFSEDSQPHRWYLWEPPLWFCCDRQGSCYPVLARTAEILRKHYQDPHIHPILNSELTPTWPQPSAP